MKILITGGAGFIGSHIADACVKKGHHVAVIDNFTTGKRKNLDPNITCYKMDVEDRTALKKIFESEKPDVVSHQAALASVIASVEDPATTMKVNVTGTVSLLCESVKAGVKKFIFASTGGAIYGNPQALPVSEDAPPEPLSPYGLSKLLAEEAIHYYHRTAKLEYCIFRYPNVYGPRQNPKGEAGVVAIFGGQMKEGITPTIFGDGAKTRDYLHVADIVRAHMIALEGEVNDTLNLGWGKEVTDKEIYDSCAHVCNFKKDPNHEPVREGEALRISLDAAKAKRVLGWEPRITLEEGIQSTLQ
jgi:UDP-glucose 4-epimerase